VTYSYDTLGRTTKEYDVPDTSQPSESTCTQSSYADSNPDETTNLDLAEVAQTLILTQAGCQGSYYTAAELISATAYTYNSAQELTKTRKATGAEPVKLNETSGGWIYPTGLLGLDGGAGLVDPYLGGQGRG
jgi:hypothetical protein